MTKAKVLFTLSLMLVAGLLISACQPIVVEGETAGTTSDDSGDVIELLYLTHSFDPAIEINNQIIEDFEASHPGVKIVYDHTPHSSYEQKILTAYAGGEGPDVFWAGDWMVPQFIEQNIIAPVAYDKFGVNSASEFLDIYAEGSLAPYVHEGEVYTGGLSEYNTFSLFINVDNFEAAGLSVPSMDEPMTWEEFADLAEALAEQDANGNITKNAIQWPFTSGIWNILILEPMVNQLGGGIVDETGAPQLTSPEVVRTFEYISDLRFNRKAFDPALATDLLADFANGDYSMMIAGVWANAALVSTNPDLNYVVVPLPKWADGDRVTTLYSWAWFVNPNIEPEKQELAWEFVEALTASGQAFWDGARYIQARSGQTDTGQDLNDYRVETEPTMTTFLEDFKYGRYEFRSTKYFEISDIWTRAVGRVLEGEDVQTVLNEAQIAAEFAVE